MNLNKNNKIYEAYKVCTANREDLENAINEVDYELSDTIDREPTITDLFLCEKNLGRKCAELLIKQARYQYYLFDLLYNHMDHKNFTQNFCEVWNFKDTDLNFLRRSAEKPEFNVGQSNGTAHVSCANTGIAVDCSLLVEFADKFLNEVKGDMQNHVGKCQSELCRLCVSFEELLRETIDVTLEPLLSKFGSYQNFDEASNESGEDADLPEFPQQLDDSSDIDFNDQAPSLQEEYTFERYRSFVLARYRALEKYYNDHSTDFQEAPVILLYNDTQGDVQVKPCNSISEANQKANLLNSDILKDPFSVVFICETKSRSQDRLQYQKHKKSTNPKVGKEDSPFLNGFLRTPVGKVPYYETSLLFYLDTGADSGSIGYIQDVVTHFISTVEMINEFDTPAILCNFNTPEIMEEDMQVFDVDRDPQWNAIGLSALKKYCIFMDIKNNKIKLAKHEDVEIIKETNETFLVAFNNKPVTAEFPTLNEDLQ